MILPFESLNSVDFELSDINVLFQRPSYRHMSMSKRKINGFLYITEGEAVYTAENGEKTAVRSESVIYLPADGARALEIDKDGIAFYRVDFNMSVGGERVVFSDKPMLLAEHTSLRFKECISRLAEECRYENNRVSKVEWLLGALGALLPHPSALYSSRLGPALKHLDEHYTEEINCHALAELCYLSTAQFYKLFTEKFKKTPLEYRNERILKRAELLLSSGELSVAEAAECLGFSSASYFSRFFKKNKGYSPSEFTHNKK